MDQQLTSQIHTSSLKAYCYQCDRNTICWGLYAGSYLFRSGYLRCHFASAGSLNSQLETRFVEGKLWNIFWSISQVETWVVELNCLFQWKLIINSSKNFPEWFYWACSANQENIFTLLLHRIFFKITHLKDMAHERQTSTTW